MDSLPYRDTEPSKLLTRAQLDVSHIANEPHMMGADAHKKVQDYIVNEFNSVGIEVNVIKNSIVSTYKNKIAKDVRAAYVENIIAKIKGTSDLPAIALMAHYDSRDSTSGAGDDASGVSVLLAAARKLIENKPPLRDVYFIVTDGEEFGLFGAQQFFLNNPIHKKIGLVMNFEGRGSAGTATLFETGKDNYSIVKQAAGATKIKGSSLSYSVYKNMNNDTDLSIAKKANIQGLNFAFGDGFYDYHTGGDKPENLSAASLNDQLTYALDLSQHFANLEKLPLIEKQNQSEDATFFNPLPGVFVFYGEKVAYLIGILALILSLVWFYQQYKDLKLKNILMGLLSNIWLLFFIGFIITILNNGLYEEFSIEKSRFWRILYQYHLMIVAYTLIVFGLLVNLLPLLTNGLNTYLKTRKSQILATLILFVALVVLISAKPSLIAFVIAAVLVLLMWLFYKPISIKSLGAGAVLLWIFLLIILLVIAPEASYFLAWPLLIVCSTRLLIRSQSETIQLFGLGIESLAIILLFIPMSYLVFVFVGHFMPFIPVTLLLLGLLLSIASMKLIGQSLGVVLSFGIVAIGVILLLIVSQRAVFNERYAQPSSLYYLQDEINNQQYWSTNLSETYGWDKQILGDNPQTINSNNIWPTSDDKHIVKPVIKNKLAKAEIVILDDYTQADKRFIKVNIKSSMHPEYLNLMFKPVKWYKASIDGNAILNLPKYSDAKEPQSWWRWRYYAIPKQGITIDIEISAEQPFEMRLIEVIYSGKNKIQLPKMPKTYMPMPYGWANANVIVQHKIF